MKYSDVTNPVYASADKSSVSCLVQFAALGKPVPFLAMASDTATHGQQIYADLVAGKYGPIAPFVAPVALMPAQQFQRVIAKGVAVTCPSNPALSATYPVTPAACAVIRTEAAFVSTHKEFTDGSATYAVTDLGGQTHVFDMASLLALDKALTRYVAACKQTLTGFLAGANPAWPSNAVNI